LKHEIFRKALDVAFDRLHQHFGLHVVEHRQIGIAHHTLFAQSQDSALDVRLQRQARASGDAHEAD